ncbi:MAG: hypothetical protein GIW94_01375 [Candidatus Eremiobacteraeota bacterium]|nr:hypothetical protein [Candidatus Eremiobacteraeota bacterium]MBC5820913.1 hypothetical protein [Candidatus Eremiobacteraeota bacterium]
MFTHDFNVYETLNKLDSLLESGHDDPSPMDKAEYARQHRPHQHNAEMKGVGIPEERQNLSALLENVKRGKEMSRPA